jgi:PPOX class probable F420-dependent enzyme
MTLLSERERDFLTRRRVGHLATADRHGAPHVVPVCYAIEADTIYVTIDQKPKSGAPLKRLANLAENPAAALVVDRYDENWARLAFVMLRGAGEILAAGAEHDAAQALLRTRYPQYGAMDLADLPVIALRIARVTSWGALSPADDPVL